MRTPSGKLIKKEHLPARVCHTCGRPFVWRKKWARVWAQVNYCSDRCRNQRGAGHAPASSTYG